MYDLKEGIYMTGINGLLDTTQRPTADDNQRAG